MIQSANSRPSGPSVSGLFRSRCPSAIAWLIVAIVVRPAVNACPRRAVTHVGVEILKVIQPARADLDSPAAVKAIVVSIGIRASLNHGLPRDIHTTLVQAVFPGDMVHAFSSIVGAHAPTRELFAVSQAAVANIFCNSAVAATREISLAPTAHRGLRDNHEFPKTLANHFYLWRSDAALITTARISLALNQRPAGHFSFGATSTSTEKKPFRTAPATARWRVGNNVPQPKLAVGRDDCLDGHTAILTQT